MKYLFIGLNIIALGVAIAWYINSKYDYEPLIAIITLFIALLVLIFNSIKKKNKLKLKGNKNKITQDKGNLSEKENEIDVEGDDNEIFQDTK